MSTSTKHTFPLLCLIFRSHHQSDHRWCSPVHSGSRRRWEAAGVSWLKPPVQLWVPWHIQPPPQSPHPTLHCLLLPEVTLWQTDTTEAEQYIVRLGRYCLEEKQKWSCFIPFITTGVSSTHTKSHAQHKMNSMHLIYKCVRQVVLREHFCMHVSPFSPPLPVGHMVL